MTHQELSQKEEETYNAAARLICYLADPENAEEAAAGQRIVHMAGMRALVS